MKKYVFSYINRKILHSDKIDSQILEGDEIYDFMHVGICFSVFRQETKNIEALEVGQTFSVSTGETLIRII